jgi:hypothetical protein
MVTRISSIIDQVAEGRVIKYSLQYDVFSGCQRLRKTSLERPLKTSVIIISYPSSSLILVRMNLIYPLRLSQLRI